MNYLTLKKEKNDLTSAFLFSLLIHFTAGALLIFGLSTGLSSSPRLNGMHLVWVSLNNQGKQGTNKADIEQPQPVTKAISANPATIEKSVLAGKTQPATVSANPVYTSATVQYASSGTDSKAALNNIKESGAIGTAGKPSGQETVIAYPLYKENTPPVYPEIARARGYEGIVLVSAEILPNGRVGTVKIQKSSGYAILDQSALQAVKPWKFEPAKKSGNPFTAWVELPIKFILRNNSQS